MKRVFAIFLMVWLPLFMQSAWAMSTHMLAEEAGVSMSQASNADNTSEMPCHQHDGHAQHHCNHCVACAVSNASASFDAMPNFVPTASAREVWPATVVLYRSIYLPPLVKPPIFA